MSFPQINLMSMNTPGTFVDPKAVVELLGITPGSTCADFGCGAGYFTAECARATGDAGRVYAMDVMPSALEAVESHCKTLGISCVTPKRANLEKENGSGLPQGSIDWVIAKDMLFQNDRKHVIIGEIARVLKPGGQALLMEWNPQDMGVGPDAGTRIAPDELKSLASAAGLSFVRDVPVGGFHYAFVVKK